MGKLNFKAMKIIKILVLVTIALMFNASSIVIAQKPEKDSTKNTLATLPKDSALKEEKDNAAAQQQEAQDVTTHNEQEKSAEDKNKESRKKSHYDMLPDDEKKKVADEALREIKEKLDKKYYDLLDVDIQAEVRKKAQKEFVDTFEKVYRDSCEKYRDTLSWYKIDTVSRYIKDTIRLYNSFEDQKNTNEKLTKIRDKAIHDLETKIAEAKKLPISKLEEELNACKKEYESLGGEGDPKFKTARDQLDKLGEDLKLFNGIVKDKNSTLKSPYSAERVNSALKTIEVLKGNSDECDERSKELDRTATLLKEYESITQETRNLIDYVGDFLALFKKYNSKQIKNEIDYDSDLKTQLEKTNSIPYLKEQYDLFWKELEKGSLNSDSVKAFIQKVENK